MNSPNDKRLQEDIEVLAGTRGRSSKRAAVRVEDLAGLLQVPERLKSAKAVGTTPTKAEFDALVEDVATLHTRLRQVVSALQDRVVR